MSTDRDAFVASLGRLDVDTVRVPPADVGAAIEDVVVGDAVGVAADAWPRPLPETVTWDPTPAALWAADTGVTPVEFAVADYGSLLLPTSEPASELVSLYADHHVAVVSTSEVLPGMEAAFERLDRDIPAEYRDGIIATGPSATADMGALVEGAHGPKSVSVVLLED